MNKPTRLWILAACLTFTGFQAANAQQPGPQPLVEVYGCNFNGNNDMDDLLAVTARWNTWANQRQLNTYTALIMTPYFFSPDLEYDALWLGAYPNGAAMAAGQAQWFAEGQAIQDAFDAVATCDTHQHFVALGVRAPASGPGPATGGFTSFSNCTLHAGRRVPEAIAAAQQWTSYLAEMGAEVFSALLIPIAGETADADYNFKQVIGFGDIAAYGKMLDVITSGGVVRANELFGNLMDCDSSRIYSTNRVRQAAPN